MKPLIGITGELEEPIENGRPWGTQGLLENYHSAIFAAGALPVTLPLAEDGLCEPLLRRLDGLILSGGLPDIPAEVLGEDQHHASDPMPIRRWHSEQTWYETAAALDLPILGICLGMQLMHVLAGGKMIQDIPDQYDDAHDHAAPDYMHQHDIIIEAGTQLAKYAPALRTPITSAHHQAVKDLQPPYRICARSEDGIIEAIEDPTRPFRIGVQWHPERSLQQPDWLLQAFAKHCAGNS